MMLLLSFNDIDMKFLVLNRIVQGVLTGAMMIGQAVAFTPDYEKAKIAAVRIFRLLELRPTIDAFSQQGTIKVRELLNCSIMLATYYYFLNCYHIGQFFEQSKI